MIIAASPTNSRPSSLAAPLGRRLATATARFLISARELIDSASI